jgi:hypothetical protein
MVVGQRKSNTPDAQRGSAEPMTPCDRPGTRPYLARSPEPLARETVILLHPTTARLWRAAVAPLYFCTIHTFPDMDKGVASVVYVPEPLGEE